MEQKSYLLAQKQVCYLYQYLNLTVLSIFIAISLILYVFWDLTQIREPLLNWYFINVFILLARVILNVFYQRTTVKQGSEIDKPFQWIHLFIFSACLNGSISALLIFIVPDTLDYYYTYVLLLLSSMIIASIASLGVIRQAFFTYLAAMSIPIVVFYLTHLSQTQSFHLYAYLIIFLFTGNAVMRFNHSLVSAFTMEIENTALKVQLSKETDHRIQAQNDLFSKSLELQGLNESLESKVKEKTNELETLAFYDTLTQLPNRHHFYTYLERTLSRNKINPESFALFFIDLDEFKNINDTLGHDFGDTLLIEVASRLRDSIRVDDFIARISGDEFTIILKSIPSEEELETIADNIIRTISQPYSFNETQTYISCSIGIALYPQDGQNIHTLLKHSDLAMYYAKEHGKNSYHFYNHELYKHKAKKFLLATELKTAIKKNELLLVFQPQVHCQSGKVSSLEVLLRWHSRKFGPVPIDRFIPIAEESSQILELEDFAIKAALTQVKLWNKQFNQTLRVALNISGFHFRQKNFVQQIESILYELQVDPQFLELELTESAVMKNTQESIDKLTYLKQLGIKISIDDFGTGYSSMSYLKQLPIDSLKIDKSFIDGIPDDSDNKAITLAIIELAHQFNLETVAEGVENKHQDAFLKQAGCSLIQGYYYYKPLSAEEIEKKLHLFSIPHQ
ncbi:MAG: EAL domain-containing protein [Gammaproteobacteria bacterium]|nr:EAL domain-containing protein [Gammaproteobacteria bacterium]